ncbi:MAG: hypothetical protein UFI45_05740 [Clostridia bacterium]|nr:hypothetical protein [Clostridia bacterium]
MAVCYFNDKYDEKYDCQYEVKKDGIEIVVNYDIDDEIPAINGVRTFGINTEFKKRDILIIDYQTKMNYLLKNAYYCGHSEVLGTPDGGYKTRFFSRFYFWDKNYEKICDLQNGNNIKKIRIYSNIINELIGYPSLYKEENKNEYIIKLRRDTSKQRVEVNLNNIKSIEISDDWTSEHKRKSNEIDIKLNGYIEIEMDNCINYEDIYNYVQELIIYFQLLKPCKFNINKIVVEIEKLYYGFCLPINEMNYKNSYVEKSVTNDVLEFLLNCYSSIPYRNSKNEIRNIPYIILETSRNLEDNFLMFYRFIECYYKQQPIKDIKTTFIKYSIENNYKKVNQIEENIIENIVYEIISLRNHYVHEGYYIKDKKLYIAFPKVNGKANPKNYIAKNVDVDWIYEKTKILYEIVVDIIFRKMLNYDNYKFNKHF